MRENHWLCVQDHPTLSVHSPVRQTPTPTLERRGICSPSCPPTCQSLHFTPPLSPLQHSSSPQRAGLYRLVSTSSEMHPTLLLLLVTLTFTSTLSLSTSPHLHPRASPPSSSSASSLPVLRRPLGSNSLAAPEVDCPLKAFAVQYAAYLQPPHASVGNWTDEVISAMGLTSLCNFTAKDISPPPFIRPSTIPPPQPSSGTPNPSCQFEKSTPLPHRYSPTITSTCSSSNPVSLSPCAVSGMWMG